MFHIHSLTHTHTITAGRADMQGSCLPSRANYLSWPRKIRRSFRMRPVISGQHAVSPQSENLWKGGSEKRNDVKIWSIRKKYLFYFLGFGCDGKGSSLVEIVCRFLALFHDGSYQWLFFFSFWRGVFLLKENNRKVWAAGIFKEN